MNFKDNKAIYLQIADRIGDQILSGALTPEGKVPSVRELAAEIEKKADADKYRAEKDAEAKLIQRQREAEARKYEQEKEAEAQALIGEEVIQSIRTMGDKLKK